MVKEKRRPGRPRRHYVFRCMRYPFLAVEVPAWRESEKLKEKSNVQFWGGLLRTEDVRKERKLSEQETEELIEALKGTQHVYVAEEITGEHYPCGFCSQVFTSRKDLEFHMVRKHAEDLNIATPNRTPWDPMAPV